MWPDYSAFSAGVLLRLIRSDGAECGETTAGIAGVLRGGVGHLPAGVHALPGRAFPKFIQLFTASNRCVLRDQVLLQRVVGLHR